jgi:hypothetical protein
VLARRSGRIQIPGVHAASGGYSMKRFQTIRPRFLVLGTLLAAGIAVLLILRLAVSHEPHGKYVEPHILLVEATAFYEFKDGKVFLVIDGVPPKQQGTYLGSSGIFWGKIIG